MSEVDNRIESLREPAQSICRKWLQMCAICMYGSPVELRILETLRSEARQAALQKDGKSLLQVGWHNVGLAWDFAVIRDGVYLQDDASGLYTKCGLIGEALGCVWGGRWAKLRDYGHLEYHPGFTLQQFLNGQKSGVVT